MPLWNKLSSAALALALLASSACEEEGSTRKLGPMDSMSKLPRLEDVQDKEPTREDYIRASIGLGCMPRTAKQENLRYASFHQAYEAILTENRFRDRRHYQDMKRKLRGDQDAKQAISVGVQQCLGLSDHSKALRKVNIDPRGRAR